jgi:hypothetical protein
MRTPRATFVEPTLEEVCTLAEGTLRLTSGEEPVF